MLQGDFFTISSVQKEGASVKMVLELNASHPIFAGHFPQQPVVPGACLLQIVKEVMQTILVGNLQLIKAHQLKFISPIDPNKNNRLAVVLTHKIDENKEVTFAATISCGSIVCFTCNGIFRIITNQ